MLASVRLAARGPFRGSRRRVTSVALGAAVLVGAAVQAAAQTPPPLPAATSSSVAWSGQTVDGVVRTTTTVAKRRTAKKAAATTTTAPLTAPRAVADEVELAVVEVPVPPTSATGSAGSSSSSAANAAAQNDVWYRLRMCESRNNYAINTGNGYYGAYQFALPTWRGLGYSGYPHEAPPAVQDEAARKLQAKVGWGAWPACSRKLGLR